MAKGLAHAAASSRLVWANLFMPHSWDGSRSVAELYLVSQGLPAVQRSRGLTDISQGEKQEIEEKLPLSELKW